MTITTYTKNPKQLINSISKKITDNDLKTWDIVEDSEGEILYTHTPAQWNETAMPKPYIETDHVCFKIIWWENEEPDEATKGYIIGRFTEILMVHFREQFTHLEIK
jgi:hypothetical protein